jgi:hypothetical protein
MSLLHVLTPPSPATYSSLRQHPVLSFFTQVGNQTGSPTRQMFLRLLWVMKVHLRECLFCMGTLQHFIPGLSHSHRKAFSFAPTVQAYLYSFFFFLTQEEQRLTIHQTKNQRNIFHRKTYLQWLPFSEQKKIFDGHFLMTVPRVTQGIYCPRLWLLVISRDY